MIRTQNTSVIAGPSRATVAGPGKPFSRSPVWLSQPHSVGAEIETPKGSRGGDYGKEYGRGNMGSECPPHHPTRGLGE